MAQSLSIITKLNQCIWYDESDDPEDLLEIDIDIFMQDMDEPLSTIQFCILMDELDEIKAISPGGFMNTIDSLHNISINFSRSKDGNKFHIEIQGGELDDNFRSARVTHTLPWNQFISSLSSK